MGKIPFFTPEQKIIFDQISKNNYIASNFYFTGGTALSAFYLGHRFSEDLDFFSQKKFDNNYISSQIIAWSKKMGFTFRSQFKEVVYIFNITFNDKRILKLDFGYYPYKQLEKGVVFEGIIIDSLLDLAVNKLLSINQRADAKDFVDLYFLLGKFTIWDLIEGAKIKFNMETDPWLLSTDFLKIEEFDILPKMIRPLSLTELKQFFREKAKELAKKSVK